MRTHRRPLAVALAALLPALAGAQQAAPAAWDPHAILKEERYVRPPAAIERIVLAPRVDISFDAPSPDRAWFLRTTGKDRGSVAQYGAPHIYLGGLALDTRASRARALTVSTRTGLTLVNPRTGATRVIQVPAGATISAETWSPTGTQVAFIANFETASHAYVADVATGRSVQVTRTPLLATLVTELHFTADGRQLLVVLVPEGRGPQPTHGPNDVEDGPAVRLSGSRAVPQPVHWSLLHDAHDQALLRWHTTGQLALVDVARRTERRIGAPAMIRDVDASHDATHFRVTRIEEPFSYLVPVSSFGTVQELWDASGRVVATLQRTPVREEGRGGVGGPSQAATGPDTGKRSIQWNPVGPGLVYLQSVFATPTGGNGARGGQAGAARGAGRPTPTGVRYMQWLPPYGPGDTKLIHEGGPQFTAVAYSVDGRTMFVNDSGMVSAIRVADPSRRFPLGRGVTLPTGGGFGPGGGGFGGGNAPPDTVGTGGALQVRRDAMGLTRVVTTPDGQAVFVTGQRTYGAQWETRAPRPWVDRLAIESAQRTRLLDSPADTFERFVVALDDEFREVITTRQSATVIEDAFLRDTRSGTLRQLTKNVDVAPEVTQALRKRIRVTRARDGVPIWVDLVLPRGWQRGGDMPGVIWFYPREYATDQAYQRSRWTTNVNQFPAVPAARPATATELWAAGGYVFIEPDVPILGDSGRMNDNYTRDLAENLNAIVDAVVDSGFVRRDRIGIGGHSYGAFSTVNAMTLVPYFKAGIAGDGMYNRTLTPFGFQSERRSFYEAQDTYLDMSPFLRADKLSGALLLYHNLEDQNVGTAPMSSIRMFQALQGLGKEAALYLYPYEDHSVMTYESDLDQWARWIAWFDVHVKGVAAAPRPPAMSGTLLVTNKTPSTATIVDVASGRTLATLPTGNGPHEIVLSRDGRTAVVTDYGTGPAPGSTLTVIDVPGLRVARTIPLGEYRRPHGIVLLPGDSIAAVTVEASRAVLLVNVRSGAMVRAVPTEQNGSHMVGVAADGRRAWTGDIGSNTVTELDLVTGRAVRHIDVPNQPEAINVTPDGSEAWVGSNATGRVSVVDARTGTVTTAAEGFQWPYRVLFTPDARLVLLPDYRGEELRFVERASRREVGRMRFPGGGPQGIALTPDGRTAVLSMSAQAKVTFIDVATRRVVGELAVGETPDGVVYSPIVVAR